MARWWWPRIPAPLRFGALFWSAGFAYVGSFWTSFAIFFDPLGPQNAENKQNHA